METTIESFTLLVLLMALLPLSAHAAVCRNEQTYLSFFLQFDLHPEETAFRLECDDGVVQFERRIANDDPFVNQRQQYQRMVHERRCIDSHQTCYLIVTDSAGNGMAGMFRADFGGSRILDYHDNSSFDEIRICLGVHCPTASQENAIDSSCHDATFTIFLDEHPEEVGYRLVCDNEATIIWNVPAGTFFQADAGNIRQAHAPCLPVPRTACWLTVTDSYGDGLTASSETATTVGYFALMYGSETVAFYNGAEKATAEFSQLSFCFGPACTEETSTGGVDCDIVSLSFTMDELPRQVGFDLQCGDDYIWDFPVGTMTEEFETFTKTTCITGCCTLRITDTYGHSTASYNAHPPGLMFDVRVAGAKVDAIQSAGGADFSEIAYSLGTQCDEEDSNPA